MWPYGLFPAGHMGKKLQVPFVYNSPPGGIQQLNINELVLIWYVSLFLQDTLEELDKNPCWLNFCHQFRRGNCS